MSKVHSLNVDTQERKAANNRQASCLTWHRSLRRAGSLGHMTEGSV